MLNCIDNFCGCGGSTTGLKAAGIEVSHAANHWKIAIETHNTNHPEIDHSICDLNLEHPCRFPKTELAWFSPACTSHSPAGGRKRKNQNQLHLWDKKAPDPSTERSRMTAWQVVNFTEYFRYTCVMVENVVEFATDWELFDVWLEAMHKLGYEHQLVWFNSQFCYPNPVPQSRDRLYIVFHRKGNRAPNLDFRPPGWCRNCREEVNAIQTWKNPAKKRGKYGPRNQYLYNCPRCKHPVVPHTEPAKAALDLSLPCPKIKDRTKPLSENTLKRIQRGLERFCGPHLIRRGHWQDERLYDIENPCPTVTTKRELYLNVLPFIDTARSNNVATPIDEPISTLQASRHHSLIQPPQFLTAYHGGRDAIASIDEPSWTVATNKQMALVKPEAFISSYYGQGGGSPISEPSPTMRTTQGHALIKPDISALVPECGYRMLEPTEAKLLMGFGADYVIVGKKEDQFKQCGNAVTPPVAQMIGRAVLESLA